MPGRSTRPRCTPGDVLLAALVPTGAEDDVAILAVRVEDPGAPAGRPGAG